MVRQFPVHDSARTAAEAALAAAAQGRFWPLHDRLMSDQDDLSKAAILEHARAVGLDAKALARALDEHTYRDALEAEAALAIKAGVRGTPTFFINGLRITGARPITAMRATIDEALGGPSSAGAAPEDKAARTVEVRAPVEMKELIAELKRREEVGLVEAYTTRKHAVLAATLQRLATELGHPEVIVEVNEDEVSLRWEGGRQTVRSSGWL
jgi:hypothetical protein